MPVEKLQAVLLEFQGLVNTVLQSGEQLDDALLQQIAEFMNAIMDRIEQSQGESPADQLTPEAPVPQLDQGPFPSSNVNAFKYNPKTQQLFVKFHGKDSADSGPVYGYQNVPQNIYDVFAQGRVGPKTSGQNQYHRWIKGVTPSLGASLNALIKEGGYPYQRMS